MERVIHDGPYNDIQNWDSHRLPDVFGGAESAIVRTEGELEEILARIEAAPERLYFVEVRLDPLDCSAALKRLGKELGRQQGLS